MRCMKNMTLSNIANACNGKYYGPENKKETCVSGIAIDSRKVGENFLFIPIKGEKVDGHAFIPNVFENKAACTLTEHPLDESANPFILVESCAQALKDLAEYYRSVLDIKVVGIAGSVGKTSTKEMVASVLSQKYSVLKTEGNFNNEIGLPLTIFNITDEHDIAVVEMGISDFGEMHRLAKVAKPDICIITNIGFCHLENLKSREGILKAKSEIFDFLTPDGKIILNGDDDLLSAISEVNGVVPIFFSKQKQEGVYADNIENLGLDGTKCSIHFKESSIDVHIPIPGLFMVDNALTAFVAGKLLGLSDEQIRYGIHAVNSASGRTNLIKTEFITIIDDCYNANPVSMKGAIDVLSHAEGRKIAVLGDMFELGKDEASLHYSVGLHAADKELDLVICVGTLASNIAKALRDKSSPCEVLEFISKDTMLEQLESLIKAGDTILVKASHAMGFDEIVSKLKTVRA